MWYWNKDNFEGLAAIASLAAENKRLASFADYCRYREQGLRQASFRALESFIDQVKAWPEEDQRQFVEWLCRTQHQSSSIYQLIPHQLMNRVVLPVLQRWATSEPRDSTPHRWLGFVTRVPGHFRDAVEIDSDDDISRLALLKHMIGDIEYSCHHLPEFFIGSPDEALRTAEDAATFLAGVRDAQVKASVAADLDRATQQVKDWLDFQATGEGTFDDWCARRDHSYARPRTYWYTKKNRPNTP